MSIDLKIDNEDAIIAAALKPVRDAGLQARVVVGCSQDWEVGIASGAIESVEEARSQALTVSVFADDGRSASVRSSDLDPVTIDGLARECVQLALAGAPDPASRLPDADACGLTPVEGLDDGGSGYQPELLTQRILEAEAIALAQERITATHRSGASCSRSRRHLVTTTGVDLVSTGSRYGLQLVAVAEHLGERQMGYEVSGARQLAGLYDAEYLARQAVRRAVEGFGWRKVPSSTVNVIFDNKVASELVGLMVGLMSGSAVYRGASCWADQLGKPVASTLVQVTDDATLPGALGSRPCDGEGVRSRRLPLIEDGVLQTWLTDSYSARRLQAALTGHAGGSSNVCLRPGEMSQQELLRHLGTGLLVTQSHGHGVDLASGQWSKGVSGFWVEGGEIQYPVQNVTLAMRLQEVFKRIEAIGNDPLPQRSTSAPSMLISGVMLGGS